MIDPVMKALAYLLYPRSEFMDPRDVDDEIWEITKSEDILSTYTYWDTIKALEHYKNILKKLED